MEKHERETSRLQIHIKNQGKEKLLSDIADAYRALYPRKYAYFKTALAELRKVQKNADGSYMAGKGREVFVRVRVPTELWCYIKRWDPDFGSQSADIELLCRVWGDLVRCDRRKRVRLWTDNMKVKEIELVSEPVTSDAEGEGSASAEEREAHAAPGCGGHDRNTCQCCLDRQGLCGTPREMPGVAPGDVPEAV